VPHFFFSLHLESVEEGAEYDEFQPQPTPPARKKIGQGSSDGKSSRKAASATAVTASVAGAADAPPRLVVLLCVVASSSASSRDAGGGQQTLPFEPSIEKNLNLRGAPVEVGVCQGGAEEIGCRSRLLKDINSEYGRERR
jgi:hypothetical protein